MCSNKVKQIKAVGEKVASVMGNTAEYLQSHRASGGLLVAQDGSPLTIGAVKRRIESWLGALSLHSSGGVVFAVGREAGYPHEPGTDSHLIPVAETIVCDLFPRESQGEGFFFDMTRTWCMSYAPPAVERAYADILAAFESVISRASIGTPARLLDGWACEILEARGHLTAAAAREANRGFVHALGHGVGLQLHEPPYLSARADPNTLLSSGCVVAIEPGLYYPDHGGYGVRIEDCVWMDPKQGRLVPLVDFSKELVLPIQNR